MNGAATHNGTLVTFTTDLGRLEPQEARTSTGQAVVTLHAGTESKIGTVRAFSGGARSVGDAGLALIMDAAAAEVMTVAATPVELPSRCCFVGHSPSGCSLLAAGQLVAEVVRRTRDGRLAGAAHCVSDPHPRFAIRPYRNDPVATPAASRSRPPRRPGMIKAPTPNSVA